VLSFHWGIARGRRGRAQVEDFQVVKYVDAASPLLFDAVCSGQHIKDALFTLRKAGDKGLDFYKVKFEEVLVSSVTPAGSAGGDAQPMEELRLDFESAEIEYRIQNPDGSPGGTVKSSCTPRGRRSESESEE
jgi:type VI secretion system secreted protein Hcp